MRVLRPLSVRLALLFLVQAAVLIFMIGRQQMVLVTGREVVLETQPADPLSLFRGEYIQFGYDISALPLDLLPSGHDLKRGDRLWVILAPGDVQQLDPWQARAVLLEQPERLPAGQVALQGVVRSVLNERPCREGIECPAVLVDYGIESYFVPEGEAAEWEASRDEGQLAVLIAVGEEGRGIIKGLVFGNRLVTREGLL